MRTDASSISADGVDVYRYRNRWAWFGATGVASFLALALADDMPIGDLLAVGGGIVAPFLIFVYLLLVRPSITVSSDEVISVKLIRTQRFRIADIRDGASDYYGGTFHLFDGSSRCNGVLATANYQRWLGRSSRGDRVVLGIVNQARQMRDEIALEVEPKHSLGNPFMAIWVALGSLLKG